MSFPIGAIREFSDHIVRPATEHVVDVGGEIANAFSNVARAVHEAGRETGQAISKEGCAKADTHHIVGAVVFDGTHVAVHFVPEIAGHDCALPDRETRSRRSAYRRCIRGSRLILGDRAGMDADGALRRGRLCIDQDSAFAS